MEEVIQTAAEVTLVEVVAALQQTNELLTYVNHSVLILIGVVLGVGVALILAVMFR